ncbi:MAG: chorismate synthase, partial [Christensenellaceae bacterium]|nr:chorismate synthase [Christensenellaceae bacterium]
MSTFHGEKLYIGIAGASHAEKIELFARGFEKDAVIDLFALQNYANRRKADASKAYSTSRVEPDLIEIKSGIDESGKIQDGEIRIVVKNTNFKSGDYKNLITVPRPSHADYPAILRSKGEENLSGGGKFSGRMTLPLVIAGGIAVQILGARGITFVSKIVEIGGEYDPVLQEKAIIAAKEKGDSVGGIIEVTAYNCPVGLGGALFDGLESTAASLAFAVPAVKGVEFGKGFEIARLKGSAANDCYQIENGKVVTTSNNNGGIVGGMTNGMPVIMRAAIKPTPSISLEQDSVDLSTMQNTKLVIKGRHDA